jgi:hypothetical protein
VDLSELIRIRMSLEARLGPRHEISPLDGDPSDALPQLSVLRHAEGFTPFFHERVPTGVREKVLRLAPGVVFESPNVVRPILGEESGGPRVREAYHFPIEPEIPGAPAVVREGSHFIASVDGAPASWAWSVRIHRRAELASVETVPAHRREGMARVALGAWARAVVGAGKVGFFEHPSENVAAKGLALRVGARPFATVVDYW